MIHGWTFYTWCCFGSQVELVYLWIALFSATVSFLIKGFMVSSGIMQYFQESRCWVVKSRVSKHIVQFPNGFTLVQSLLFQEFLMPHSLLKFICWWKISVSCDHPVMPATGWPQLWRSTTHRGINRPFVCIPAWFCMVLLWPWLGLWHSLRHVPRKMWYRCWWF